VNLGIARKNLMPVQAVGAKQLKDLSSNSMEIFFEKYANELGIFSAMKTKIKPFLCH